MVRPTPLRPGSHAGFTLVEVLVALLVMAVLAAMAWRSLDGIVRTRDASQGLLDRTLRLQTVIGQWEQDLGAIVEEPGAVPQALQCDGSSVRLTRRSEGGVQLVVWSLRPALGADAAGPGLRWTRWAGPAVTSMTALQEQWMRSQQFNGSEPGQLTAAAGLAGWQVYFYQGNTWSNCQSTGNVQAVPVAGAGASSGTGTGTGAPTGTGTGTSTGTVTTRIGLPQGVRLVLTFAEGSGIPGSVTRDIVLPPS